MQNESGEVVAKKGGWNWGWGVATVYTVFALGTLAFAYYSFSQKVELVSTDYYNKEIAFDQHASRVHNSQALKTPVTTVYESSTQTLKLHFPLNDCKGTVLLYRPSESGLDKSMPLQLDAAQEMSIPTSALTRGMWRIQIEWESAGKLYYDEFSQTI